jgi:chorismate mutase/prephenate dehydratase
MEIQDIRARIDRIDDEISSLYVERMKAVREIVEAKREGNRPVLDAGRERAIIGRITQAHAPIFEGDLKLIYSLLFDLSRSAQARLLQGDADSPAAEALDRAVASTPKLFPKSALVACQGAEGAYSQQACDALFNMPGILYFNSFEGVFQAVEKGLCRYGMLPLENSLAGSVTEVYDLMKAHKFFIARSVKLRIHHRLLVLPGVKLEEIREVVAHEQALRQCGRFLAGQNGVKLTPHANNATAAKLVAESQRRDLAAIASAKSASLYGLEPLDNVIMDDGSNYTRFICICRDMEIYPGANRISLMAALAHEPGALYKTVARFAVQGLNLLKIESRPIPGRDFEFMFYFEFEGSVVDDDVRMLLSELSSAGDYTFFGNYSEV